MIETIKKLVECYGPSGHEDQVRALILGEIDGLADEVSVDPLGNIIAWRRCGREGAPRVMLSAHMDEIGIVVSYVDEKGFLRFSNVGGLLQNTLNGNRVRFADGTIGVIHIEEKEMDRFKAPDLGGFYIDVEDGSGKHNIQVGDAAGLHRDLEVRGDRLIAKSMDDRISCAIQIEVMRQIKSPACDVAFVFSVQEEVGLRGATTAAFGVDPHIGIAIDVTRTGDTPKGHPMEVSLGKGPAVKIKDSGMLASPQVIELMEKAAKKAGIPYQREVLAGGTTDARAIQTARAGIPSGCLSVPCRYVHTTSETVDMNDVRHSVTLLTTLLESPVG